MSITVRTTGDRTLVMSRSFAAPRALVWAAHTQAEHLRHWWGRGNPLDVEIDFVVGGKWRFVEHADGEQHAFRGEYRAIDEPGKILRRTFVEESRSVGHVHRAPRQCLVGTGPVLADQWQKSLAHEIARVARVGV